MEIIPGKTNSKNERLFIVAVLALAVAAAIYFRVVNLRQFPGWYSDEGNQIDLAENWIQGKWQNYGVIGAPYIQRPPLYMYAISSAMQVFGVDIGVSRRVSAFANLMCIILVGWIAWHKLGPAIGVLSVWVMAIAPWIVLFGRLGLTYNLMAPFFIFSLIAAYFWWQHPSTGWMIAGGVSSALAFATDYLGIICGVTVGLVLIRKNLRAFTWFTLIFLLTFLLTVLPLLVENANIFFTDMFNQFLARGVVQSTQSFILSIIINYSELLRRESWILLGFCGLFLIEDRVLRNIILIAVGLTLIVVTKTYTPVGLGLHYLMHLFPFFALGLAVFILQAYELLKKMSFEVLNPILGHFKNIQKTISISIAALIVFSPLVWMFLASFASTSIGTNYLFTGNDNLFLVDAQSADKVREYISPHINKDDLVFGSPVLIWGLGNSKKSDFLTGLAFIGKYPREFPHITQRRFTNDQSLVKAKYVILDPLAEEFAPKVLPGMNEWLDEIHSWPIVFETGEIKVYERNLQ